MLDRLIAEGDEVNKKCIRRYEMLCAVIGGEIYAKWISKCILFLEKNYPKQTLTKSFIEASTHMVRAYGGVDRFDTMIGILKGIKEFESEIK